MARKNKYNYFKAFERQADYALELADLLIDVVKGFEGAEQLVDAIESARTIEHHADGVCHDTYAAIAADFITPFDREDLVQITSALDDVIDEIEEVISMFYTMDIHEMNPDALQSAKLIRKSCESLKTLMPDFADFKKSKKFRHSIEDVNDYEERADRHYDEAMRRLFTEKIGDPLYVMVWSRLFTKLETCCDNCEHVADLVSTVLIKNS